MPEATQARPSYGRWYILGLICLMYLITYLDRVNISTAAPEITKEFGFDKITLGWIFSAFVWAYALFQVPGGWLSDRFGAPGEFSARQSLQHQRGDEGITEQSDFFGLGVHRANLPAPEGSQPRRSPPDKCCVFVLRRELRRAAG